MIKKFGDFLIFLMPFQIPKWTLLSYLFHFCFFWERGTRSLPLLRLPLSSLLFLWMRLHVDDDLARKEFSCSYICDKTYLLLTYLPTYSSPIWWCVKFCSHTSMYKKFRCWAQQFSEILCKNTYCRCLNNVFSKIINEDTSSKSPEIEFWIRWIFWQIS